VTQPSGRDPDPPAPARPGRFPLALNQLKQAGQPAPVGTRKGDLVRPQRHLQQAAADSQRRTPPSGLGLDSSAVRTRMVQRLRADAAVCEPVLAAFEAVPRHQFVDSALVGQAYEDTSLPIGLQQTISKPSVVARMLSLLCQGARARQSGHLGRVLEIGTGCGYQTALLAHLARNVVSIERLQPLHERARQNLAPFQLHQVRLLHADGRLGHAPHAPYDTIIAAAGGEALPDAWVAQLAVGGRIVAPMVDVSRGGQVLLVVDRHEPGPQGLQRAWHDAVHFVPLKSGLG
jgi:protein-L-isoaspartate(D-aspartate) O-methyltransferase